MRRPRNESEQEAKREDEHNPNRADIAAPIDLVFTFNGHEPLEDALGAKRAKTPAGGGQEEDDADAIAIDVREGIQESAAAEAQKRLSRVRNQYQRQDEEADEHPQRLEHIRPARRP